MVKVVVTSPGERVISEFDALVAQPTLPATAKPPGIGLVEISQRQATELIPGPVGPQGPQGIQGIQGPPGADGSPDTAAQVLAKLLTVDGAGSGLDADLLDGQHGAYYLDWTNFTSKPATFPPTLPIAQSGVTNLVSDLASKLNASAYTAADVLAKMLTVDGAGTGLDADLLDGHDTAYFATAASLAGYLPIGGGTLTGPLILAADPSVALGAATKAYVDAKPAGAVISDTPPASPSQGQTWWESDTGNFYIWFIDVGGAPGQWVQVNGPVPSTIAPAPRAECYLDWTGSNVILQRRNGNSLYINGVNQLIPAAGVQLAATGLTTSGGIGGGAAYYLYAYMSGSVMTLEASATGYTIDANSGLKLKTGDPTRTFVGIAYVSAAATWASTNRVGIASQFNPERRSAQCAVSSPTSTAASYTELGAGNLRVFFVNIQGREVYSAFQSSPYNSVAGADIFVTMGLDAGGGFYPTARASRSAATGGTEQHPMMTSMSTVIAEGSHYVAPLVQVSSAQTATFLNSWTEVTIQG